MNVQEIELARAKNSFRELTPKLHADKRFVVTFLYGPDNIPYPSVSLASDTNPWGAIKCVDVLKRAPGEYQLEFTGGMFILLGDDHVPCQGVPRMVSDAELDDIIVSVLEQWISIVAIMEKFAEEVAAMCGETILPI